MRGSRLGSALAVAALLAAGSPTTVHAAEPITEATAHAIGVQAYVYLYPLVTMDITRRQLTNVARAEGISAPPNSFANIPEFPSATMRAVVRPNFDTLYSSGWVDLTKEPVIVSAPTPGGAITSCRCSICGPTFLPLLAGARRAHRRTTGRWYRLAGAVHFPMAWIGSRRPPRTSGLSAEPRLTDPPTTMPCTRSRRAIKSLRCRVGRAGRAGHGNRRSGG